MSVQETKRPAPIDAEEFDRRFDEGEDMSAFIDWSQGAHPNLQSRRVNVDFPAWMVRDLDRAAKRLGVTRQALIKVWLAERLEDQPSSRKAPD
jgi:alpha/beta superfamily hydrolase